MTILFFGTSEFAVPSLAKLAKSHKVAAVVTRPDKPQGRDLNPLPSPVKAKARSLGLEVISIDDMSPAAVLAALKKYKSDIFIVIAYGKLLSSEVLSLPRLYSIGLHASLLPKYRGASPINWAILNGEEKAGATVFKLSEKMDAGEIIMQRDTEILRSDNTETLSEKLSNLGADLLVKAVDAIDEGKVQFIEQAETEATFTAKLKKEDGKIEWERPAADINNRVRAFYGWPGAFSRLNGRAIKVWVTEVCALPAATVSPPGQITAIDNDGIAVACGNGALRIKELQAEGGKRMTASVYVLGNKVAIGDRFVN